MFYTCAIKPSFTSAVLALQPASVELQAAALMCILFTFIIFTRPQRKRALP